MHLHWMRRLKALRRRSTLKGPGSAACPSGDATMRRDERPRCPEKPDHCSSHDREPHSDSYTIDECTTIVCGTNSEALHPTQHIVPSPPRPLAQTVSPSAPQGLYLETARFRAFQAGILPVWRFAALKCLDHPSLVRPRAQQVSRAPNTSLSDLVERLYKAAGEAVPEYVREKLRQQQLGLRQEGEWSDRENLVADRHHEEAEEEEEKRSPHQTERQASANNPVDDRDGARLSRRCTSPPYDSTANTPGPPVDGVSHSPDKEQQAGPVSSISEKGLSVQADSIGSGGPHSSAAASKVPRARTLTSRPCVETSSTSTSRRPQRDDSFGKFHIHAEDEKLNDARSVNKESEPFPEIIPQGLSPILAVRPSTQDLVEAREMTAVNKAWPAMAPGRPTTASWDDLISRNHERKDSLGESVFSENDARQRPGISGTGRPRSSTSDFSVRARARGRVVERPFSSAAEFTAIKRADSPGGRPVKARTMTYHADQRDSSGFASHMAAMTGNPPPLKPMRVLRASDSMPELNLGASAERNRYTTDRQQNQHQRSLSRPSISARPSRLAESITMADLEEAQMPPARPPLKARARSDSEGRIRAMSWHGRQTLERTSIFKPEPLPNAPLKDLEAGRQRRPEMIKHMRTPKPGPNELFNKLPFEVLGMIMGHLRRLHLERSNSCATCWLRDCCSIALGNRKWVKAARDAMYEDIQLIGPDSAQQTKKYKGLYSTRLVLLRRTLRADHKLAATVRFLKVPALPDDAPIDTAEYHDTVASVVMACPNLERLDGFYPIYNHGESRLFNALSSRKRLKEMTWVVDAMGPDMERSRAGGHKSKSSKSKNRHSRHQSSVSSIWNPPHNYLGAAPANKFVRHHMDWSELTHLSIHCLPGAQLHTPNSLLNIVQTYLTSLQSLHLSHVPPQAFHDTNLLSLPKPLKKLSLSHCTGVTTAGLSAFATSPSAQDLETLTLVHQDLDTLPAVVRLLANLTHLTTFSLVQPAAPTMPDDELNFLMMPYLGSNSLRFLHWDVFDSATRARNGSVPGTKTDDILTRSIAAHGFPNLRFLRVPCDPDGLYQALCRPKERVDLPGDRYRNGIANQGSAAPRSGATTRPSTAAGEKINTVITKPYAASGTLGPYSSSAISLVLPSAASDCSVDGSGRPSSALSSDDSAGIKALSIREAGSDLHQARLRAQTRLEAARGFPLFEANITNEEGMLIESTGLAGYLGDIKSQIVYTLAPDVGGSDERGGLVGIFDLLSDCGEDLSGKGDSASRSGAGYGTGCVASEFAKVQAQTLAETSEGAKGKSAKSTKNSHKAKDSVDEDEGKKASDGCTGRWNSQNNENFTVDRKMGDRWWHVERGRWRGRMELS